MEKANFRLTRAKDILGPFSRSNEATFLFLAPRYMEERIKMSPEPEVISMSWAKMFSPLIFRCCNIWVDMDYTISNSCER